MKTKTLEVTTPKHTPGPWDVHEGDTIEIHPVSDTDGTTPLADVLQSPPLNRETALANARLMAAAPELLESLQELVDWAETVSTAADREVGKWPMFDRARSAIAKAEGKQKKERSPLSLPIAVSKALHALEDGDPTEAVSILELALLLPCEGEQRKLLAEAKDQADFGSVETAEMVLEMLSTQLRKEVA